MSETSTTATPASQTAMSNDSAPILLKIYDELAAIRELLAKPPAARPPATTTGFAVSSSTPGAPPSQPTALVSDPGSVLVPFGKNKDRPLSELAERSLEWYASDQPPQLKKDGTPFTPRPADIAFKNAARQLYHTQKGTLAGSENPTERPATSAPSPSGAGAASEENIPFAARYYDHG